jgi:uncharacterized membrane protein
MTVLKRLAANPTRGQRRLWMGVCLVTPVLFYLIAVFELYPGRDFGRLYGMASCINALVAVGMGVFLLRLVRRSLTRVSTDDRSRLAYERPFDELTGMQQDRVRRQLREDWNEVLQDEREERMQRDAERRAFRVLQRGLPVLVALYWGVCLSLPIGPVRMGLLFSAVAVTGLGLVVLSLPEVIRVWMMPDAVGEPRVVATRREG